MAIHNDASEDVRPKQRLPEKAFKAVRKNLWFAFCAVLLLLPWPARGADQAKLPYEMIYQIQQKEINLAQTYTNLHIFIRVKSNLPNVKNSDLDLYIDSKTGHIPVLLDQDGRFTVPMRQTLLDEKPSIIVNQPKGTMEFGWYVGLVLESVPTNEIHYADMMRPLKDVETIRAEMLPGAGTQPLRGMKFIYPKATNGTVVVRAKNGDRVFKTDQSHALVVPWDPALMQENPLLSIPIPPEKIDIAEDEEK